MALMESRICLPVVAPAPQSSVSVASTVTLGWLNRPNMPRSSYAKYATTCSTGYTCIQRHIQVLRFAQLIERVLERVTSIANRNTVFLVLDGNVRQVIRIGTDEFAQRHRVVADVVNGIDPLRHSGVDRNQLLEVDVRVLEIGR